MVCQRKFILKTIIDVNLGFIPGSICHYVTCHFYHMHKA
jgi:hypothetical protein